MPTRVLSVIVVATIIPTSLLAQERDAGGALTSDSRTPYVHRITLYDHDGAAIDPRNPQAPPYSPKMTCGKCHDYAAIRHGWHFNANDTTADGTPRADAGRPGEPWLWVERASGTVLPLSGRGWPGTFTPQAAGISAWEFTKRFGRHTPGGGFGELSQREMDKTAESARWTISGALEVDCMMCHSADMRHDPAEAAQQIADENFRWAPTAALGLGVIRGQAKRLPDEFDPLAPPSPDRPDQVLPKVVYDRGRFDGDDRVYFNVTRTPPAERCYFCHTQRLVGPDAPPVHLMSEDVHLSAGLTCTDCHVNGIDHMITRGVEASRGSQAATLSCEECHLGDSIKVDRVEGATVNVDAEAGTMNHDQRLPGRLGAPYPQHAGIPTIHFEKLSCTACHSGLWPDQNARNIQTALAHGLGLGSKERQPHDPPHILAPVFAPQADGRIGANRMVWPAFFGVLKDGKVAPVARAEVTRLVAAAHRKQPPGSDEAGVTPAAENAHTAPVPLRRELISGVLQALRAKPEGTPVYISEGRLHRLNEDGSLKTETHEAAAPYLWPLAHDVRPAGQSLGVRGCTDCHAQGAPFFFGSLAGAWPGKETGRVPATMIELQGVDSALTQAWAFPFAYRWLMAWVGWGSVAIVAVVLLAHGSDGVRRLGRR